MISRIGNSIFFIGLILLVLAAIVSMPLAVPIGIFSTVLMVFGAWLWSKKPKKETSKLPLSQQPARNKILAGVPAIALITLSFFIDTNRVVVQAFGLFLMAYALVGLVELKLDTTFPHAKTKWESLAGWKKFLITVVVIISAFIFFCSLMPLAAKVAYE